MVTWQMMERLARDSAACAVEGLGVRDRGVSAREGGSGRTGRARGGAGAGGMGGVELARVLQQARNKALEARNKASQRDGGDTWQRRQAGHTGEGASVEGGHARGVYRIWSSDFHVGPIGDLKLVWADIRVHGREVEVVDKSLSGSCAGAGTCAKGRDLRVLNQSNGQDLGPEPEALIDEFVREYREDAEMQGVDAVVCSHPAAMCEVFEGLRKTLIVYATTRY
jgi:hypothetical protein